MSSGELIDINALLTPISESAPTGADLRADAKASATYYTLKDARRAARAAEKTADEAEEAAPAGMAEDWRVILASAPKVLAEQSKDLEVATWYTEALLRERGFAGLRDGFAILNGIVEQYWDTFFSLQDEDGLETRLAPLTGLNGAGADGTLIQPLLKTAITAANGDDGPFSMFHFRQAEDLLKIVDPAGLARRVQQGAVTLDRFNAAVSASGGPFYVNLIAEIQGALDQFNKLTAYLADRAGDKAPPSSNIHDQITNVLETVKGASKDLVASVAPQAEASNSGAEAAGPQVTAGGGGLNASGLNGREDALRMLLQIAAYFRTNEPQSPISSILEETVRRARLSFAELLADLITDDAAWRLALTNAGIKPPAAEG